MVLWIEPWLGVWKTWMPECPPQTLLSCVTLDESLHFMPLGVQISPNLEVEAVVPDALRGRFWLSGWVLTW